MTSIYQSIGEKLLKNEKWEYFNAAFSVAIFRDEKEIYKGTVAFTDKEYNAQSKDLFTLWGNMKDFIEAKRQQLLQSCNSAAEFNTLTTVRSEDLRSRPHHNHPAKALELMK